MRHTLGVLLAMAPWIGDAGAAGYAPGEEIDPSILLDLTPEGLGLAEDLLPTLVPSSVTVPDIHVGDAQEDEVCWLGDWCDPWCCSTVSVWEYAVDVSNMWVSVEIDPSQVVIAPGDGQLELSLRAEVKLNDGADPLYLDVFASGLSIPIYMACDANIDPFEVVLSAALSLDVVTAPDGSRRIDASIPSFDWSHGVTGDDVDLWGSSCTASGLRSFFEFFGWDPVDTIIPSIEPEIRTALDDVVRDLETTLEDALGATSLHESIALGEVDLEIVMEPSALSITPEGVRIEMAASLDAPLADCVAPYAIGESTATPSDSPSFSWLPEGLPSPHDIGIFLSDDLINAGLFSAWRAGLLCLELGEGDGPIPIDTSILSLLSEEPYAELFPTTSPLTIVGRPTRPPVGRPGQVHDLDLDVSELELDFHADLDYREARVLGVSLSAEAGVDFAFSEETGELATDVFLDGQGLSARVLHNDLAPGQDEALQERLLSVFDTFLQPMLSGLLSDLSFDLPSLQGIGLQTLEGAAAGPNRDFVGLFGYAGTVSYGGGCTAEGDTDGCGGGCGHGGPPRAILAFVALGSALLRRRSTIGS